ncbi:hypothetical protein D3C72_933900 [compost metagenome]
MSLALAQHLRGSAEVVRQFALIPIDLAAGGLLLIYDKATADGVVGFAQQRLILGKCAQGHGVGMV